MKSKWRNYVYLQLQKFTERNLVAQRNCFVPQKAQKSTYMHLQFKKKILPAAIPPDPVKNERGGRRLEVKREGKAKGKEGGRDVEVVCPTTFRSVVLPLL
jgi:hypothetical protein